MMGKVALVWGGPKKPGGKTKREERKKRKLNKLYKL